MICRKRFLQHYYAFIWLILIVSSSGVFGFDTDEVSVTEGDPVTLNTGVQTNQQDRIIWFYNGIRIAEINGYLSKICTDVQCNEDTERFRDRLELDHQTGSLTIMNTRITDSGEYTLVIFSSIFSNSEKIFSVSVHGESVCLKANLIHLNHIINVFRDFQGCFFFFFTCILILTLFIHHYQS